MLAASRLFAITAVATLAASLGISPPAKASEPLLIWPIDPVIDEDRGAGALWLENRGTKPTSMQVRIYRWTQENGEDRYEEQSDVEASPPIATIEGGSRQLIRLTSNRAARAAGENAYRILIDEIPVRPAARIPASQSAADSFENPGALAATNSVNAPSASGIRFQMRYSLPLFVYAPLSDGSKLERKGKPQLHCTIAEHDTGQHVRITNTGATHARLSDMSLNTNGKTMPVATGLVGYVLPGNTISQPLPQEATGREAVLLTVNSSKGTSLPGCAD